MAGAARVAPASRSASWLQRPGPRSRHQGQAQAGQLQASLRSAVAQSNPKGSQQMAWCHHLAIRGGLCGLPTGLLSTGLPPSCPPDGTWNASHRGPRDQAGLSKKKEAVHGQGCNGGQWGQEKPREGSPRKGRLQSPLGQTLPHSSAARSSSLKDTQSLDVYAVKTIGTQYGVTKPWLCFATMHPLNFHLPAPTRRQMWCQALEDKETYLPTLPATARPTLAVLSWVPLRSPFIFSTCSQEPSA